MGVIIWCLGRIKMDLQEEIKILKFEPDDVRGKEGMRRRSEGIPRQSFFRATDIQGMDL